MKNYNKFFLLLTITFNLSILVYSQTENDSIQQKDVVDVLIKAFNIEIKKKSREDKQVSFSIIPIAPSSSAGRTVAVSSVNAAFYLGPVETTNISNIYLIPYADFKGSLGLFLRPNIWSKQNTWNYSGEFRIATYLQYTYGLGANTPESDQSTIGYNHFRLYASVHRKVVNFFYLGGGLNFDSFYNIEEIESDQEESPFSEYGIGTSGTSLASGLTFNLLRDNRKNSINPKGGYYSTFIFRFHEKAFGSDYEWSSIFIDLRKYFTFSQTRHSILGFWAMYWGTYGEVPYLNLPGTSMEVNSRTGRGYNYGRYRGKQMLYAEGEYRFDISANGLWGGVVFANMQSYTEPETEKFQYIKPAIGTGLRLKFDKKSQTNITLDFAMGKDSYNVRVNLGEFF
ncbi:MAG: BamA/TamA family outer membrane protein [Cyclobacteriaceae bacterium]|nr:BamA/TamA family outer membrane protein [Cyclobacteriaceae bacterium]